MTTTTPLPAEEKNTKFDKFPDYFTSSGLDALIAKNAKDSTNAQSEIAAFVRGYIIAATSAAVALRNGFTRFDFHGFITIMKRNRQIPFHYYLDHKTCVFLVSELMAAHPKRCFAGRVIDPSTPDTRQWFPLTKPHEFQEGDDFQLLFSDFTPQENGEGLVQGSSGIGGGGSGADQGAKN